MSQFKGTKQHWRIKYNRFDDHYEILSKYDQMVGNTLSSCDEDYANALLISKCPEMLDMLNRFLEMRKECDMRPEDELCEYANDIRQLIKEVTELDAKG